MKKTEKKAEKKCSFPKCQKKAGPEGYCPEHQAAKDEVDAANPEGAVLKVTELEAAKFSALDAEIRNNLQGVRIMDLEIERAERAIADAVAKHHADQANRQAHKTQLMALVEKQRTEYTNFVDTLAKTYKLDPKQFAIDPESRTIRDLRKELTPKA